MILALAGLVALQSFLLKNAMAQKEQAFRRNVQAALGLVAQKLAARDALQWASQMNDSADARIVSSSFSYRYEFDSRNDADRQLKAQLFVGEASPLQPFGLRFEDSMLCYSVPSPQHVQVLVLDQLTDTSTTVIDSFFTAGLHRVPVDPDKIGDGRFSWRLVTDSTSIELATDDVNHTSLVPLPDSSRRILVQAVINKLTASEFEPLQKRIDTTVLDEMISSSLEESGIEMAHAYAVTNDFDDEPDIFKPAVYREELSDSPFRARLFPHDFMASPVDLVLFFPSHRSFIWSQIAPMLVATVLLTLVIIGIFAYTIRTIFAQRQFSTLLVDFINNMTHEFKTPISTVALACEAINRPDVGVDREKVLRFNGMIQNENRRMRNQVDKILQMAVLEEGDYELECVPINLHTLISQAVASVALHIETRHGSITSELAADRDTVDGDAVHLANVIHNLLDNANKYSPDRPTITVRSWNEQNRFVFTVADNGIGLRPEDRKMVFDKYFRVPSGNVHDVKGFGIGLSYVKLIVTAHGGQIRLDSEPGKGTTVTCSFPLTSSPEEA
jgi:two-component system phosphate regulon sensor histidine kinase PhoR